MYLGKPPSKQKVYIPPTHISPQFLPMHTMRKRLLASYLVEERALAPLLPWAQKLDDIYVPLRIEQTCRTDQVGVSAVLHKKSEHLDYMYIAETCCAVTALVYL